MNVAGNAELQRRRTSWGTWGCEEDEECGEHREYREHRGCWEENLEPAEDMQIAENAVEMEEKNSETNYTSSRREAACNQSSLYYNITLVFIFMWKSEGVAPQ